MKILIIKKNLLYYPLIIVDNNDYFQLYPNNP